MYACTVVTLVCPNPHPDCSNIVYTHPFSTDWNSGSIQQCAGIYCFFITNPHCPLSLYQMHPDSDPSNPGLHGQFVELNEAFRVLSKEVARREYDLWLQHPFTGGQAFRPTSTQPQVCKHTQSPPEFIHTFKNSFIYLLFISLSLSLC